LFLADEYQDERSQAEYAQGCLQPHAEQEPVDVVLGRNLTDGQK